MAKRGPKTPEGIARSLANLRPPWGSDDNPPPVPRTAGAVVKEWWNIMAGWSKQQLEDVAQDETETIARRAAANRWLASKDAKEDLEQIIGHTDGKAAQHLSVKHSGDASPFHALMERLKADPVAMAEVERMGRKLFDGGDGPN